MIKIIVIQIYNNLQVLWSSKVKFVSLCQLLKWPFFGSNSGPFTALEFIVSLVGIKNCFKNKGKKEEVIKKERRKERKKELNKQRKSLLLALNQPSEFWWSSWLGKAEEELVLLFSLPESHSLQLPSLQPSSSVCFRTSVPFCTQPTPSVHQLCCPRGAPIRGNSNTTFSFFAVLDARDSQRLFRIVQPPPLS